METSLPIFSFMLENNVGVLLVNVLLSGNPKIKPISVEAIAAIHALLLSLL
jgi:hypothetical protein